MGALPKIRISKGRKNRRRAQDFLSEPALAKCPKCAKTRRPHFLCSYCGHYGEKPATATKQTKKTEKQKEKEVTAKSQSTTKKESKGKA